MDKERIPVLVGIAQMTHREKTVVQLDPLDMMAEVSRMAVRDAGIGDLKGVDSLYVVNCLSRAIKDPCRELSKKLCCTPQQTGYSGIGATAPQWFVNLAGRRIFEGSSELVLICGAEAFYTHGKARSLREAILDYLLEDRSEVGFPYVGDLRPPCSPLEYRYGLFMPIAVYPIIENSLRAHLGKPLGEHFSELCSFCAQMSEMAPSNQFAWRRQARTPEEIGGINEKNRMVAFPYTKLMCSNMAVNQAAAVIMTSLAKAEALGIPHDKIVFVRGSGEAEDVWLVSERPNLWSSPSVRIAVEHALHQIPLSIDDVEYLDLYSCFPCAPRVTLEMIGISPQDTRSLTVTGGMSSFGGPGNNYALHAICLMVEKLRENPEAFGMVQALSWFLSKHSVGIYSGRPGKVPWNPREEGRLKREEGEYQPVMVIEKAEGKGKVESYTVLYDRNGEPSAGTVMGREESGNRFLARVEPEKKVLEQMTREEIIGVTGDVRHDLASGINWFYV